MRDCRGRQSFVRVCGFTGRTSSSRFAGGRDNVKKKNYSLQSDCILFIFSNLKTRLAENIERKVVIIIIFTSVQKANFVGYRKNRDISNHD